MGSELEEERSETSSQLSFWRQVDEFKNGYLNVATRCAIFLLF
jgi:hypothetical protein